MRRLFGEKRGGDVAGTSEREWLKPVEVSEIVALSPSTLCDLRKREGAGPPFIRVGSAIRYRRDHVQAWLDSLVTGGGPRGG